MQNKLKPEGRWPALPKKSFEVEERSTVHRGPWKQEISMDTISLVFLFGWDLPGSDADSDAIGDVISPERRCNDSAAVCRNGQAPYLDRDNSRLSPAVMLRSSFRPRGTPTSRI